MYNCRKPTYDIVIEGKRVFLLFYLVIYVIWNFRHVLFRLKKNLLGDRTPSVGIRGGTTLKALSSEMDPAEIRLIRKDFFKGIVASGF